MLLDLFDDKLVATKVKTDRRRRPRPDAIARQVAVVNFVLSKDVLR